MSEVRPPYDEEIELFEFFEILWDGKWKILATTVLATLVGVALSLAKPNSFEVSTSISGKPSVFIDYIPINDVLKDNGLLLTNESPNGYLIDAPSVFQKVVDEFNDYEEMLDVVSKDEFVRRSIQNLNEDEQRKQLLNLAKRFAFVPSVVAPDTTLSGTLSFRWHDDVEGAMLFGEALQLVLTNVKASILRDLDKLARSIDVKIQREMEILRGELKLIPNKHQQRNSKRIQYLAEQSAIAKELGIDNNMLDSYSYLSLQFQADNSTLNANVVDRPDYLRGFKAIDKEISLIKGRSEEEQLLMASNYIEIKERILSLENNLSAGQLRRSMKLIEDDGPRAWVEFDFALADKRSQKSPLLYVALPAVLGGIFGIIYVLLSNAIRKRKEQLARL